MSSDVRHRSLSTSLSRVLLLAFLLAGVPAFAAPGTPAQPPPGTGSDARWNSSSSLKPALIMEDFTWFAGHDDPWKGDTRQFYAVDIENGILFTATGMGLQITDVRGGPTSTESSYIYGWFGGLGSFPGWAGGSDADWFVKHLDAPEGNPTILALSMEGQGFAIVNTKVPGGPVVAYHGIGAKVSTGQVYSVRAAGTDWAYAANSEGHVVRFNLSAASGLISCLEEPPVTTCPNVFQGVVTNMGVGWSTLHGVGSFLATGKWTSSGPMVKIWSLADPAQPAQLLQINASAMGVAIWRSGTSYYLARLDKFKALWIHDVSCIASGPCSNAPVVWSKQLTSPEALTQVTVSQAGGRTYLYVGGEDQGQGGCVAQREYLFDVTTPATASQDDLTPKIHPSGYWGWYYSNCATGFNGVGPRIAKVYASTSGTHLYRAANSLLDAHTVNLQTGPPVADFTFSPAIEIYPGTEVQFTDLSSGHRDQWTWTFQDGSPAGSNQADPAGVTFATAGQKTVTLHVASSQNGPGTPASKPLTVIDPLPVVGAAAASPARILQCQPVTLTATGVTGKPPLTPAWAVQGPGGPAGNGSTNPFEWVTTASTPTGTYTATFTATNEHGSASKSTSVIVDPVQPITATSFAPTNDPFTAGTVQLHVNVANATAWSWDFDDDKNAATSHFGPWITDPVAGPNPVHSYTTTGARQVRVQVKNCVTSEITSQPLGLQIDQVTPLTALFSISGGALCFPGTSSCSVNAGVSVTFLDASVGADAWWFDWDGNNSYEQGPLDASAFDNRTIKHTYAAAGTYTPKLKVTRGSGSGLETKVYTLPQQIVVGSVSTLKADFTYAPPTPIAGQAVSFNGAASQGSPESYTWSFGDGSPQGTGAHVVHAFTQAGSYQVRLTVSKQGTSAELVKTVVVSDKPPLIASFNSDICNNVLGICSTDAGKPVTFTDSSTGTIVSRTWDFGDGETATGSSVTHTYSKAGSYQLTLTISDGSQLKSFTRTIIVNGALTESMLLPWIGKAADGPLVQSSDFYLHNPSAEAITVTLEFIQRGNAGTLPPVQRTIAANATLFVSDVVKSLFGLDNMTGFLAVKIDQGNVQPVLISFNTTSRSGGEFGQTIPGFVQSDTGASATTGTAQVQHLVGLNDNDERLAYFGFSNPADSPVTYTLRFFDALGNPVGTGETLTLGRLGAKQFQTKEIRTRFGLTDKDDYRVVVETPRNARLFPYGANVRIGSADPSFLTVGTGSERAYLLGALSTPGMNNSVWRSDLVLANTGSQVVIADISFTNVGATSQSTDVIHETLQPGETRRLADVIGTKWNIRNGVGVLTIDSDAPDGQLPVVQGESYENTNPAKRYGQTLPALTDAQAAGPGQGQYLVGLRQDAKYRTTFWMFNPDTQPGLYDVVFRNLEGQELGRLANVGLGAGKLRQLNQVQFPAGLSGGFTVQVIVKQGKALAAAQVVNNVTNDPAYVQGETR